MIDALIEKCLKILEDEEIDGVVFLFKKIGKSQMEYYSIIFPGLSFKISSFIFKPRTLTVSRKKKKKKKKKKSTDAE